MGFNAQRPLGNCQNAHCTVVSKALLAMTETILLEMGAMNFVRQKKGLLVLKRKMKKLSAQEYTLSQKNKQCFPFVETDQQKGEKSAMIRMKILMMGNIFSINNQQRCDNLCQIENGFSLSLNENNEQFIEKSCLLNEKLCLDLNKISGDGQNLQLIS
ncbi:UNKNOWN [Stylonychia lemnae]|uniref:Uncharacterized protein n=1 Tax=Stylonychia lemnae TaxID=5949 RepID=A0A078BBT9_STYLE|nr:UNKNOWN [Stylonychia lemnae]|eukprot:CDW91844.1 UNKNOWN [Stylonychia lemnae]